MEIDLRDLRFVLFVKLLARPLVRVLLNIEILVFFG